MPGRVFISCGQATDGERQVAAETRDYFAKSGFTPYVAIQAQSIQDVNTAIISELKSADYYVFVDFARELLPDATRQRYRGSLFTHQELAIAYTLGFDKAVFLQQDGVELEGLLRYTASNATKFSGPAEVLPSIRRLVQERGWLPTYSRHLVPRDIHWSDGIIAFGSHTGEGLVGRFLYLDLDNRRQDLAAFSCVARLAGLESPVGILQPVTDRSHLKVTGQPGFVQTIWPSSTGAFDLLMVKQQSGAVCLNNALDVIPKPTIITNAGHYRLRYEVLAEAFPTLKIVIDLHVTGDPMTTEATLGQVGGS